MVTWDALIRSRDRAREGGGGLTILEGAPGVGRTTFLRALSADSRRAGFRVFAAEATPLENPPPFDVIRKALASAEGDDAGSAPTPSPSSLAMLPARFLSTPEAPSDQAVWTPPEGTVSEVEADRHRLVASLARPVLDAATRSPVMLALDDVHQADPASLEFVEYLLGQISGKPIWVVATLTTDLAELPESLQLLLQRPEVKRIPLPPLTDRELEEFLGWLEPQRRFTETEIHRLYSMTGGVPVFVERLVRHPPSPSATPAAGKPEPAEVDLSLPELSSDVRQLLNLASAIGDEFSFQTIVAASGLGEEQAVEGVEKLIELEILRELEFDRLAFARRGLRHRVYASLTTTTVRLLHQRIAQALERIGTRDPGSVYALARHTYLGRLDEAAVRYNREAAELASSSFQPSAAIDYLEHALEALRHSRPDDRDTERKIRLQLALEETRAGELARAEKTLAQLQNDHRVWDSAETTDQALLAVYLGRVLAEQGRWDEAERALQNVPSGDSSDSRSATRRAALRLRGEVLFYRGDYRGSLEAHEEALRIATEAGDRREAAAESIRRATALSMLPGREAEARAGFDQAVTELVALGDQSEAAFGLLSLGAELLGHRQIDAARAALVRAVELSSAAHDLRRLAWAHLVRADLELESHNMAEAESQNRQALALFKKVDDALGYARTLLTEGRLATARKEFGPARRAFQEAREIFAAHSLVTHQLEVDLWESEVDLSQGMLAEVRQRLSLMQERELERLRPDLLPDFQRLRNRVVSDV